MANLTSILLGAGQILAGAFLLATGAGAAMGGRLLLSGGLTLISALMPRKSGSEWKNSPRYGFDNAENVTNEGGVLPVVYGRERMAPPLISVNPVPEGEDVVLYVLACLGEGEIDSVSDIELDDVPLSSFPKSWRIVKRGTADQTNAWKTPTADDGTVAASPTTVRGFDQVARPYVAGTKLTNGTTHVYVMKDAADSLGLNFVWPAGLYRLDEDNAPDSTSVGVKVEWKRNGEADSKYVAFLVPKDSTGKQVQGAWYADATAGIWKTSAKVVGAQLRRQIRLDFPAAGSYTVRVTGTIDDDDDRVRVPTLAGVVELANDSSAYANRALLALKIVGGGQLSNRVPKITCIVKGRKVYDPRSGLTAWSQNAALITRDALLNDRYGGGEFYTSADLDEGVGGTWRLAADYFEETVTSRGGVAEHRSHCDLVVDQASTLRDWITQVLGARGASLDDSGDTIKLILDKAAASVRSFEARQGYPANRSNMLRRSDGTSSLEVRRLSESERFNVIDARFTDETDRWRQRVVSLWNLRIAVGAFTGTPTAGETLTGQTSKGIGRFVYATGGFLYYVQDGEATALASGEVLKFSDSGAQVTTSGSPLARPSPERRNEIQLYGVTRPSEVCRILRGYLNGVQITPHFAAWGGTVGDIELEAGDVVALSDDVMQYVAKTFRILDLGRDGLGAMRFSLREYDAAVYATVVDEVPKVPADGETSGSAVDDSFFGSGPPILPSTGTSPPDSSSNAAASTPSHTGTVSVLPPATTAAAPKPAQMNAGAARNAAAQAAAQKAIALQIAKIQASGKKK